MKKLLKFSFIAAGLIMACSFTLSAQKIGYIDANSILYSMPEMDSVQIKLEAVNKDLQDTYEAMTVERNNKMEEFQQNSDTYSDATKKLKESEIQSLLIRMSEFEGSYQQTIADEQQKLLRPLYEKLLAAIKKVGKDNSYTTVLDISAVLYYDEATVTDLKPLVEKELGVTPK